MSAHGRSGKHTRGTGASPISVLTPAQERFLEEFFRERTTPESFYLSGGTALAAYYLHHRYSDDLDFFTRDREALRFSDARVQGAAAGAGLQIERVERRDEAVQYFLSGDPHPTHPLKKVELIFDTPPYFASPCAFGRIPADDLLCIAVNKLTALARLEPKDYVDLYLVVREDKYRLEDLIPLARQKDAGLDEFAIAATFKWVRQIPNLAEFQRDYMLVQVAPEELARFYEGWAARLFSLFPPRRQE